jgi:acetyl esterase/lipase
VPLDPQIKRILDMMAAAGAAHAASQTLDERREAFRTLMGFSDGSVPAGRVEDHAIPGDGGRIAIRVYTPVGAGNDRLPGIVFFHGGGLVAGSLDTHDRVCRRLAHESGCRVVAVGYRLAPEHKFPAGLMDSYAATVWTAEHAGELGIDRDRIAIGGDSAGATLAAVVCQMMRQARQVNLAAQLLLCPIMDFAAETASRVDFADGIVLSKATMERDLEQYLPAGVDATDPRISPLRAADLSGLPPACIHTAECDPLRDEGQAYADRLSQAGVKVKYTCHAGMIHLFYVMASVIPYARTAMAQIGAELRVVLG